MTLIFVSKVIVGVKLISDLYHKFYGMILELFLCIPGLSQLVLVYFKCLMYFRLICIRLAEKYTVSEMQMFGLLLVAVASRLKITGLLITMILVIVYLEMAFSNMATFYRKRPLLMVKHFPEGQDPKRPMHKVAQAIVDAVSNPVVVATATTVAGALAWKGLDVWDTHKQFEIAQQDRDAAALQAQQDRETAALQAQQDREAAALQAQQDREAAALQAQQDRDAASQEAQKAREFEAQQRALDREAQLQGIREQIAAEKKGNDSK